MPGLTESAIRRTVSPRGDRVSSRVYAWTCRITGLEAKDGPLIIDRSHILVLNYNGQDLLAECLPSIVQAARLAPVPCRVTVVDNGSADDPAGLLAAIDPEIGLIRHANRGLASFNEVLAGLDEPVVLLLNNDVKLAHDAVGPLLETFKNQPDALFSAPRCWTFDGSTYEGMRTRVRFRRGLVQGMSRVPGVMRLVDRPDLTAAAGPVLAVHRRRFLALGGYDPVFFPGRIEDLDLGFRGWMAGFRGYYVPESLAYHKGFATFEATFGARGCDVLAIRNTLIFMWKNTSGRRLRSHLGWLPARLVYSLVRGRTEFARGLLGAVSRLGEVMAGRRALAVGEPGWLERQEDFYKRFTW